MQNLLRCLISAMLLAASALSGQEAKAIKQGEFYIASPRNKVWFCNAQDDGLMVIHDHSLNQFSLHFLDTAMRPLWEDTIHHGEGQYAQHAVYCRARKNVLIVMPVSFSHAVVWQYHMSTRRLVRRDIRLHQGERFGNLSPVVCGNHLFWYTEKDAHLQIFRVHLDSWTLDYPEYKFPHREIQMLQFQSIDEQAVGIMAMADCFGQHRRHYLTVIGEDAKEIMAPVFAGNDENNQQYYWLQARFRRFDNGEYRAVGIFGNNRRSRQARGMFLFLRKADGSQQTEHLVFTEIPEFYGYLGQGAEKYMTKKRSRKQRKGKTMKWAGESVISAEYAVSQDWWVVFDLFQVQVNAMNVYQENRLGFTEARQTQVVHYEYSHSLACRISEQNKLSYTVSIPHNILYDRPQEPYRLSTLYYDTVAGVARFIYPHRAVFYHYQLGGGVSAALDSLHAPGGYVQDWVRTEMSQIQYWYRNTYFIYGLQRVRRPNKIPGTRWIYRFSAYRP